MDRVVAGLTELTDLLLMPRGPVWWLDQARARVLKGLGPVARLLVPNRELRIAAGGLLGVSLGLFFTAWSPLWLLALGPILMGVPHLLADLRYLLVRPGLHRRRGLVLLMGLPLLALSLQYSVALGLAASLGAVVVARASSGRRLLVVVPVVGLMGLAQTFPVWSLLLLTHLHNFIAVGMWWGWRPRRQRFHLIPLLGFVSACALILAGGLEAWVPSLLQDPYGPDGQSVAEHLAQLAPGVPSPWGLRLVLLFAFAQSVHYSVWVRLVPDEARDQPTPRTFRATLRALEADFGPGPLMLALCFSIGLIVWAIVDLAQARAGYFSLAAFHGYFELAILALWCTEGRRR